MSADPRRRSPRWPWHCCGYTHGQIWPLQRQMPAGRRTKVCHRHTNTVWVSSYLNSPVVFTFCIRLLSSRSKMTHSHWRSKMKQIHCILNVKTIWEPVNIRVCFFSLLQCRKTAFTFSRHHLFLFQHRSCFQTHCPQIHMCTESSF